MSALKRAIGLMSGTSLDGVDAALLETDGERLGAFGPTHYRPYAEHERDVLRAALADAASLTDRNARTPALERAEALVTRAHAEAVEALCREHRIDAQSVDVVGFHGQTVLHRPERGLTVQIGDGPALRQRLGRPVVHDFRAADMAAGGQGAPLVPVFHAALVEAAGLEGPVAVVNVGGVANVTFVGGGPPLAFDCGPGNAPLDDWMRSRTGEPFDAAGAVAATGRADEALLAWLLVHPFFARTPPKSLDRNTFSAASIGLPEVADGAATLTAFTARAIARAADHATERPTLWIVCGGGARNAELLRRLALATDAPVEPAERFGWSSAFMEAQAFAHLAVRAQRGLPLTFPTTTGVGQPTLGGVVAD